MVGVAGSVALAVPGTALADDKAACVAASEQAQTLRDEGKYRAARTSMVDCARDACPGIVRRDCEKWLNELDVSQPTLVIGARDPKGNDVPGARVFLDGALLADHLDGKPVAVDPGEHVFRYEAPGATAVEQRVVVRVNEKNRTLTAILMAKSDSSSASPAVAATTPAGSDAAPTDSGVERAPVPAATWIFLGLAAVGGAGFAYFGLSGQSDINHMRAAGGCAPNCPESQVDSARTKLNVADVSLGVGVLSLAAAAWFFFTRGDASPAPSPAALNFIPDLEARPGGGVATFRARF